MLAIRIINHQWRRKSHAVRQQVPHRADGGGGTGAGAHRIRCRYIYNWGLARCRQYYQQHGKSKPWAELSAELTQLKQTELWLYDFDSQMLQQALADLRRAYINFFERRAKFPKFKKKKAARQSFRIPQRVRIGNGSVYVPSIGRVRIRQSQAIELPTKSASFKRTAVGHWFVTVVVEFAMPAAKAPIREEQAVGYDLVLKPPNFLVRSDGEAVRAPRYYRARERKQRRAAASVPQTKGQPQPRQSPTACGQNSGTHGQPAPGVFAPAVSSDCHNVVGHLL